jgi:hypothetical protein
LFVHPLVALGEIFEVRPSDEADAFFRMKSVGMADDGLVSFGRTDADGGQARALDERDEVRAGEETDVVPAALQLAADGDERIDVPVAAARRDENAQRPQALTLV